MADESTQNSPRYAIRLAGRLMGNTYTDREEARRDANGMLLSRSAEREADVVPIVPGAIGGYGEPVLVGKRKKRGGPITWTETTH